MGYRRAILELGGNDPLLVLRDADVDEAVRLAASGAFKNSGQRCTAVKRIIVEEPVADALAEGLAAAAATLKVGDPLDPETEIGTVIAEADAIEFERRMNDAIAEGARLLTAGSGEAHRSPRRCSTTCGRRWRSWPGRHSGRTPRSCACRIWTRQLPPRTSRTSASPRAWSRTTCAPSTAASASCGWGRVNIREVPGYRTELTPFGGTKDSGLGVKEGVIEAMKAMTFTKLYTLPWE